MRKINPEYAHGSEYVRLPRLPIDQAIRLSGWLRETDIISRNGHSDYDLLRIMSSVLKTSLPQMS